MGKLRKLNRTISHQMYMFRTLVSHLVRPKRIKTTISKAKEVRRLAERMITLGKEGSLCAARHATAFIRNDADVQKISTELAYRYKFVDRENELREAKPRALPLPERQPMDPWTKSKLSRQYASLKVEKSSSSNT